ncbi:MAG: TfoX/Sxy family protein [Hyphomicrobiaceae bacterium]
MGVSGEFTELLLDMLAPVGQVSARRMFSGVGLFHAGLMFGLVVDDTLYLKVDDRTRADFEAEGLPAFSYATQQGRRTIQSYWRAPERLLDDTDEFEAWCRSAIATALRVDRATPKSAPKAKTHKAQRKPTQKPTRKPAG